jgi:hypothetical protein
VPVHVSHVVEDLKIRRVLETVVRRWTKLTSTAFTSLEALGLAVPEVDLDHVVPCRVLVDRMIMKPSECELLLTEAVVLARITKSQHKALGGSTSIIEMLYTRLLRAPVHQLVGLGAER